MKFYYLKKEITTILFMTFIFLYSIMNFHHTFPYFEISGKKDVKEVIKQRETIINEQVLGKYAFVETFGYLQNVLGKKEENAFEVIKDKRDMLHLQTFQEGPIDMKQIASNSSSMYSYFKEKGTQYMVLLMPDKYIRGKTVIQEGYPYNYANETLDAYQTQLQQDQVPIYDIRKLLEESSLNEAELFFHSDHHWRIETAFLAFQNFAFQLHAQYGWNLDDTTFYCDKSNYNFITYPSIFLGSLGRKSGSSYVKSDDFTFIYPKFSTDFQMTWTLDDSTFTKTGRFEVALTNPSYLQHQKVFDAKSDTYSMYLDGNAAFTSIINNKDKGDTKVLFIKDSMMMPFAAFFANTVKQTDLIDPRYYKGDFKEFLKQADYDYIFSSLSVSTLQEPFFPNMKVENVVE